MSISTPEILKDFLESTSGPDYAMQHIPELDCDTQPLIFARKRPGKWQPVSVDHISNLVKESLREAGIDSMTMKSIRGASPSKVVQLFPDLMEEALALGRWTSRKTFCNHYQAPVQLTTMEPPPTTLKSNVQQVLRWGFEPTPPEHVSATDYMKGPTFWVGQVIGSVKVDSFDEGVYSVAVSGKMESLYHYELMEAVSRARS